MSTATLLQRGLPPLPDSGIIRRQMSLEEYLAFLESPEAHEYYKIEWVDGTTLMMAWVGLYHGGVQINIGAILKRDLSSVRVVAEGGLRMARSRRFADILVFDKYPDDPMWVDDPAILAVEISSPSTWREDLGPKADEYAAAGIAHYWTVNRETESVTLRTNIDGAWRIDGVLDENNPEMDIAIADRGIVKLRLSEVFE